MAFDAEETRAARSRIRVTLGTLKHYEDIWPRAKRMIRELKLIANDILQAEALCAAPPVAKVSFPASEESLFVSMLGEQWMDPFETA